jgi:hypothetical protein
MFKLKEERIRLQKPRLYRIQTHWWYKSILLCLPACEFSHEISSDFLSPFPISSFKIAFRLLSYINMTSIDWIEDGPMPPMVSSSDLFGDILGDELIDIYNAAVVGGGDDDDDMNGEYGILTAIFPGKRMYIYSNNSITFVTQISLPSSLIFLRRRRQKLIKVIQASRWQLLLL